MSAENDKPPSEPTTHPGKYSAPGAITLLSIGSLCGVSVGIGLVLGVFADRHFGTSPWLTMVGLVLGIVGAAVGSYQVIRPYVKG